jgi:hypothetical protein
MKCEDAITKVITLLGLNENLTVLSLCTTLKGKINEDYTLARLKELLPEFLKTSITGPLKSTVVSLPKKEETANLLPTRTCDSETTSPYKTISGTKFTPDFSRRYSEIDQSQTIVYLNIKEDRP